MMNNRQRIVRDLQTGEPYSAVIARPRDFAAHPAHSTRTPAWEATGNLHLSQCVLSVSRVRLPDSPHWLPHDRLVPVLLYLHGPSKFVVVMANCSHSAR